MNRGVRNVKPFYAVAALAVLAGSSMNLAKADDAPATSGPSCNVGEPRPVMDFSAAQMAARNALFMKLCTASNGALVNGDDSQLAHNLTMPAMHIGPSASDLYPEGASRGQQRTVFVAFVVELDGRTSLATVIKSSGSSRLDAAAVEFVKQLSYKSPAYLDFTPVRMFTSMRVNYL